MNSTIAQHTKNKHAGKNAYYCVGCKAGFGSTVEQSEHLQLEHAAQVECGFCGILVAEADWKEHWETSVRHQRCSKCDLYFERYRVIAMVSFPIASIGEPMAKGSCRTAPQHGGVPHENLYCMTCKIFFHALPEIREHQKENPDHLRCPECFKPFKTSQRIGNVRSRHVSLLRLRSCSLILLQHMKDAHPELLRVDLATDMKDEAKP